MHRLISLLILPVALLTAITLCAQGTTSSATATCNFDPDKQITVEYQRVTVNSKQPVFGHMIPYNKAWAPGSKPVTFFVNTPVTVNGHDIPLGAYTMFVIPAEKQWTLAISRSTDTSGRYDEKDDLVRIPMEYGELSNPEDEFSVYFAHLAPNQCSMRMDLEKSRAWVIFTER